MQRKSKILDAISSDLAASVTHLVAAPFAFFGALRREFGRRLELLLVRDLDKLRSEETDDA